MSTTLPATKSDLLGGLRAVTARPTTTGKPFLRLARHGAWIYGSEGTETDYASKWAVNPYSARNGYISWGDSEVLAEHMSPVNKPDVDIHTIPEPVGHEKWDYQLGVDMACVSGPDLGQEVSYSTTSVGGLRGLTKLLSDIATQVEDGTDAIVPVLTLELDSYKHKKYGKVYTPEFKVHDWATMDGAGGGSPPAVEEPTEFDEEEAAEAPPRTRSRLK